MTGRRPADRARGFAIIMMMVAIALLGVFAVVATRLIQTTLSLYREAGRVDVEARSTDDALRQLRADVWSAGQVTAQGSQSVTIVAGGGAESVTWAVQADGTLVRAAAGTDQGSRRWSEVGKRLSFEWDGVALAVRGADRGVDRSGGIRMLSQVKLADTGGAK